MLPFPENSRKILIVRNKKEEDFLSFKESRTLFFNTPESQNYQEIFSDKLDDNKDGKFDEKDTAWDSQKSAQERAQLVRDTAVKTLQNFFEWSDINTVHQKHGLERANQILNTAGYTLESITQKHADILFQEYLQIFDNYKEVKKEKNEKGEFVRKLGVMSGSRLGEYAKLPSIEGMNLDIKKPAEEYLRSQKLNIAGGIDGLQKKYPNATVLIVEVNGEKEVKLFKTGIVEISATLAFGKKTGILITDGDGDSHTRSTTEVSTSIREEALDTAQKGHLVSRRTFLSKDFESLNSNDLALLETAKTKVKNVIDNHLKLAEASEKSGKKGEKYDTVIDWTRSIVGGTFYEKNGEIRIDTKSSGKNDFDFDFENESFI